MMAAVFGSVGYRLRRVDLSLVVFSSLRGYRRSWVPADGLAAVTLLVIAVPEQLATSPLAGMPPIYAPAWPEAACLNASERTDSSPRSARRSPRGAKRPPTRSRNRRTPAKLRQDLTRRSGVVSARGMRGVCVLVGHGSFEGARLGVNGGSPASTRVVSRRIGWATLASTSLKSPDGCCRGQMAISTVSCTRRRLPRGISRLLLSGRYG